MKCVDATVVLVPNTTMTPNSDSYSLINLFFIQEQLFRLFNKKKRDLTELVYPKPNISSKHTRSELQT